MNYKHVLFASELSNLSFQYPSFMVMEIISLLIIEQPRTEYVAYFWGF